MRTAPPVTLDPIMRDVFMDMLDGNEYTPEEVLQFAFEAGFNDGIEDAKYANMRGISLDERVI